MIWDTLGIDKTTDIKKIKSAYSILAKQYNPEEYPDKFMEIHNAYKEACKYARNNITAFSDKNDDRIITENNITIFFSDNIRKCSIIFGTGSEKNKPDNNSDKNQSDFDFSNLKEFSQQENKNIFQSIEEIENIILDDMNKIVNDKDLINSLYIWNNFLSNKIVIDTISSRKYSDRIDMIFLHKRFIKEVAELIAHSIGNRTKIIRNTDFGFYYIDVTGKRKLYYYVKSNHYRKIKFYYNIFCVFIIFILLLMIFLF